MAGIDDWRYLIEQEVRADGTRPWPIAVDEQMDVVNGLGTDDGVRLVGFQSPGVQSIVLLASDWITEPAKAVGLEPVFSDGQNLFVMQGPIVTASERPAR